MNETLKKVIKDISYEKGISIKELSFGYIQELKKDEKVCYIINHSFPLNSQVAGKLAEDKYATYEIFKSRNVPIIEHKIIFNPNLNPDLSDNVTYWEEIETYFKENNNLLVVKQKDGNNGLGVFLCDSMENIKKIVHENFENTYDFLLCPYYDSTAEYRTIYLNGECMLTYKKVKPYIIGNGKDSLEELIIKTFPIEKNSIIGNFSSDDLRSIPKENEKVQISWKYNLHGGAISEILPDGGLKEQVQELAKKAANTLGMTFASIDIIHTANNELLVMEVNSNVYMDKFLKQDKNRYPIVKGIYEKAIDIMFEKI